MKPKRAVTVVAWFKVTLQSLVPLQPAPLQPWKNDMPSGAAFSVTAVAGGRLVEQVAVQLIAPGSIVTVPPAHGEPPTRHWRSKVTCRPSGGGGGGAGVPLPAVPLGGDSASGPPGGSVPGGGPSGAGNGR